MDVETIEQLIRVLEGSPNEELCVQKGDYKIRIKKGARPAPTPKTVRTPNAPAPSQSASDPTDLFVTAPMVGIFRLTSELGKVGSEVIMGQVIGSIESMKLANDIIAQVSGTVAEVLVEDGMPVEYGQPLFRMGSL